MEIQRAVKIAVLNGAIQKDEVLYKQINDILIDLNVEGDFSKKSYSYKADELLTPMNPILLLIGFDQIKTSTVLIKSLYLQPQVLPIELHRLSEVIKKLIFNMCFDSNFVNNKHLLGNIVKVRESIPMGIHKSYDSLITNLCHLNLGHRNKDLYISFLEACNKYENECTEQQKNVLWVAKGGFKAAIDNTERDCKDKYPEPFDPHEEGYDPRSTKL